MVEGLNNRLSSHKLMSLPDPADKELVFVVREPYESPSTQAGIVTGRIVPGKPLTVISTMPKGGCVFSDGVVEKAAEWNAGSTVEISVGDRYVNRVES